MLFGKTVLFILINQVLTVLASPIISGDNPFDTRSIHDNVLDTRTSNPFTALATTTQWTRYASYSSTTSKRDIEARTPRAKGPATDIVEMNSFKSAGTAALPMMGLFTAQLKTCFGIAVVGTSTTGSSRHLLHLPASLADLDPGAEWKSFVAQVKASELKNMKVYLRVPDLSTDLPKKSAGAPLDWSKDDASLAAKIQPLMVEEIESGLGVTPRVTTSPMGAVFRGQGDAGTMEISGMTAAETKVYVDGKVVS